MTTYSWAGRLVPAALRPTGTDQPLGDPAPGPADPAVDGDLLGWLGFTPGDPERGPLLIWPRPGVWPTVRRSGARGRHRVLRVHAA